MIAHPLDRPVWSTLTTRQAARAQGDGLAVRFAPEFGIFAAAADHAPCSLAALAGLIPAGGQVALIEADATPAFAGATTAFSALVWQMTAEAMTPAAAPDFEIVTLGEIDAPQMLALATLTQPGPFFARTHQLGDFVGVKQDGQLLAMAGERMTPPGFTEVSGVCTQPGCRGRGYAGALMRIVAANILARDETPFLHAYAHNTGAIALYRSLGFTLRREMIMTLLERVAHISLAGEHP